MTHDARQLQTMVQQAAPLDVPLTFRRMFGGIMGYANGKPFAVLSRVGLALKLSGDDHADLLAVDGAAVLRFSADRPAIKSYVVVPAAMLGEPATLQHWIGRCIANAPDPAPKKARARR